MVVKTINWPKRGMSHTWLYWSYERLNERVRDNKRDRASGNGRRISWIFENFCDFCHFPTLIQSWSDFEERKPCWCMKHICVRISANVLNFVDFFVFLRWNRCCWYDKTGNILHAYKNALCCLSEWMRGHSAVAVVCMCTNLFEVERKMLKEIRYLFNSFDVICTYSN